MSPAQARPIPLGSVPNVRPPAGRSGSHDARVAQRSTSSPQVFVEKIERTLPGQLGSGLVITGCRVVMEAVVGALIHVGGVGLMVFLQGFLVRRPARIDALIERRIVQQERSLDL